MGSGTALTLTLSKFRTVHDPDPPVNVPVKVMVSPLLAMPIPVKSKGLLVTYEVPVPKLNEPDKLPFLPSVPVIVYDQVMPVGAVPPMKPLFLSESKVRLVRVTGLVPTVNVRMKVDIKLRPNIKAPI